MIQSPPAFPSFPHYQIRYQTFCKKSQQWHFGVEALDTGEVFQLPLTNLFYDDAYLVHFKAEDLRLLTLAMADEWCKKEKDFSLTFENLTDINTDTLH